MTRRDHRAGVPSAHPVRTSPAAARDDRRPWQHLAMPATFRAMAFVAPELDARPGRTLRRAHRTMSEPELAEILRVLRLMPESVTAWSEGAAGFAAFEIRVLDEPVRHLSPTGPDRFWVGPRDIASV